MSNGITEDFNNLFDWKRKKRFDGRFIPWVIRSDILTVSEPLFGCQGIKLLCLLRGKLKREDCWVGCRSIFFHGRSIRSSRNSLDDGWRWSGRSSSGGGGGAFFRR